MTGNHLEQAQEQPEDVDRLDYLEQAGRAPTWNLLELDAGDAVVEACQIARVHRQQLRAAQAQFSRLQQELHEHRGALELAEQLRQTVQQLRKQLPQAAQEFAAICEVVDNRLLAGDGPCHGKDLFLAEISADELARLYAAARTIADSCKGV